MLRPVIVLRRCRRPLALCLLAAAAVVLVALAGRLAGQRGYDTDLFPRWYGLRAAFHGRNPYGAEVTREIAALTWLGAAAPAGGSAGAPPAGTLESAFGFLYPLPGALLLAPLALLPYPAAATVWVLATVLALPAAALLVADPLIRAGPVSPRGPGRAAVRLLAVPLSLLFLPAAANLYLAQIGPFVVLLLALAVWLESRARPFGAGAALVCAAAVKPHQVAVLAACWIGSRALRQNRAGARPFLLGCLAAAGGLSAAAFALVPSWPADFLAAAGAYAAVPRLETATPAVYAGARWLLPDPAARLAAAAAGSAALLWAAAAWRRPAVAPAAGRALIATALVVPPAWESNAVILLIPLAVTLGGCTGRGAVAYVAAAVAVSALYLPVYLTQAVDRGPVLIFGYTLLLLGASAVLGRQAQPARRPGLLRYGWRRALRPRPAGGPPVDV